MDDILRMADSSENEAGLDELRNHLLDGGFGDEAQLTEVNGSVADKNTVADFISMFGAIGDTPLKARDWVAYVPSRICNDSDFFGPIFGLVRKETESIYVFDYKKYEDDKFLIGYIDNGTYLSKKCYEVFIPRLNAFDFSVMGKYEDNHLVLKIVKSTTAESLAILRNRLAKGDCVISYDGTIKASEPVENAPDFPDEKELGDAVRIKPYDGVTNLFSRNTGLLESSDMFDKRAVLVGCGSVGSFVAMELARSGVGKFVLCDTDTLEIHNICRHQCGFDDLGRYKVDAVKDKILNINPNAEVITYRSVIQRVPEDELLPLLGRNTIIIGGGDNRASADWACNLAIRTDSSFIATGCWTRAFAGEIFYWESGRKLSCYKCALGGLIDDERPESHATYFGSDEEKETLSFEPGVAADIDFVTIIAVKLALDLINRDNDNYTPRVINYLRQYTWICNTNSTKIGGERAGIFSHPLQITHNLNVHRDVNCPCCGDKD